MKSYIPAGTMEELETWMMMESIWKHKPRQREIIPFITWEKGDKPKQHLSRKSLEAEWSVECVGSARIPCVRRIGERRSVFKHLSFQYRKPYVFILNSSRCVLIKITKTLFLYCSHLHLRTHFDSFYVFRSTKKIYLTDDNVWHIRKIARPVATHC